MQRYGKILKHGSFGHFLVVKDMLFAFFVCLDVYSFLIYPRFPHCGAESVLSKFRILKHVEAVQSPTRGRESGFGCKVLRVLWLFADFAEIATSIFCKLRIVFKKICHDCLSVNEKVVSLHRKR